MTVLPCCWVTVSLYRQGHSSVILHYGSSVLTCYYIAVVLYAGIAITALLSSSVAVLLHYCLNTVCITVLLSREATTHAGHTSSR